MKSPSRLLVVATVFLLSVIWGTTWAAIRVGLDGVPPFTGVSLRFAIAAAVLLLLGRLQGVRYGTSRREKILWLVNGVLSFSVSYGVVYWCEQKMPSGLASVLFATFPLFVAILAHYILPDEPFRPQLILGSILGFGGVGVIFSEDLAKLGGPDVAFASMLMLVSPLVSAVASVAIKRWGGGIHHLSITSVSMAIGAGLMGVVAGLTERDRPLVWTQASVGALLYLALVGSAVTFSLYYWLLSHIPATQLALIAYLSPVVAVTIGAVFLHEPYTIRTLLGSALVVFGVAFAANRFSFSRSRAMSAVIALAALTRFGSPASAGEAGYLLFPGDPAPPAVRALGALDGLSSFTLSQDLSRAAAAFPEERERKKKSKKSRTVVRVSMPGEEGAREIHLDGAVRALRFRPDENALYLIPSSDPTRLEAGTASLTRIDLGKERATRDTRLPLSASAMDLTADGEGLVVACRNELRVVLVPDLRSAPLFRVPGENLSVAVLAGGSRVLVGRPEGIVLVDLSDPQGRDGLPVRSRLEMPGPVETLVSAPDGSQALARLPDGRTFLVSLDPLLAREVGVSTAIAWPGSRAASAAEPPEPTPPPVPSIRPQPAAPPPPPSQAVSVGEPAPPAPSPAAAGSEAGSPGTTIRGKLTGPAAGDVKAVLVLGPDNLLREAARVAPSSDGSWSAGPLPSGTYRILVDAGGSRAASSDPPFVTVTVGKEPAVDAPDLRVLSIRTP